MAGSSKATKKGSERRAGKERLKRGEKKQFDKSFLVQFVLNRQAQQRSALDPAIRYIARLHNVKYDRLRGWCRTALKHPERKHGGQLFTDKEEEAIAVTADALSPCHAPLASAELIKLARAVRPDLAGRSLEKWKINFLKRWKTKLALGTAKSLVGKRISQDTLKQCKQWAEELPKYANRHGLSMKNLVNVDETPLRAALGSGSSRVINSRRRLKFSMFGGRESTQGSWVPFIDTQGEILMDVFVLVCPTADAKHPVLHPAAKHSRGDFGTYWTATPTGYMNAELWLECLKKFKEIYSKKRPGLYPFVLTDNLCAHRKISTLRWCIANKVHVVFLPPEVTHFLNPLDDLSFTSFKAGLTREVRKVSPLQQLAPRKVGSVVLDAAIKAREKVTPAVIKASWARVGVFPWNPKTIVDRAKLNLAKIPTDTGRANSALERATAWAVGEIRLAFKEERIGGFGEPKAKKPRLHLLSSEDIVVNAGRKEAKNKEKKERAAEAKAKRAAAKAVKLEAAEQKKLNRDKRRCKGPHTPGTNAPVFNGGKKWTQCSKCDSFFLCKDCAKSYHTLLEKHEQSHDNRVKKKKRPKRPPPSKLPRLEFTEEPSTHHK